MFGMTLGRDAHDAAVPAEGSDHEEIAVLIEGETLRAAKAAIEDVYFAILIDAIDAVVTGGGGAADVEFAAGMEGEMVGGEGGFQRRKDKNLAVRADFENGAAAVADEKISLGVKGEAGGNAHALDPLLAAAVGSDAVNCAVVAARDE